MVILLLRIENSTYTNGIPMIHCYLQRMTETSDDCIEFIQTQQTKYVGPRRTLVGHNWDDIWDPNGQPIWTQMGQMEPRLRISDLDVASILESIWAMWGRHIRVICVKYVQYYTIRIATLHLFVLKMCSILSRSCTGLAHSGYMSLCDVNSGRQRKTKVIGVSALICKR